MCLILFAHRAHPDFPLVVAANRDEIFARPTAAASFWEDVPHVLAGRDRRAGGTWMGVTRAGRWAAITNFRDPASMARQGLSRGLLVSGFLETAVEPREYLERVAAEGAAYAGFNLLVGDTRGVFYCANHGDTAVQEVAPGIHGLSNHRLDTPWPKVERGKHALDRLLASGARPLPEALLDLLYDTEIAADELLPDTGLSRELERLASAPFIVSPEYGTRSSTVLLVDKDGRATFLERTFLPGPTHAGDARHEFQVDESA